MARLDPDVLDAPAAEFLRSYLHDPALREDPAARARHAALTARSSVCSYCGVGCPYGVERDARGQDNVVPLSPLGLCVKGRTSLLTGGDVERTRRLANRGLRDDRIRVPMLRGHDGRMREVSWEEALDRAAWLFLHAREWVGPEAVAVYGNGQKTVEAIWMASLYKLVFRVSTLGANSEHCLTSAGAAHELNFGNEASFTSQQFEELELCDVAILHGTNAFITFPQAYEKLKRHTRARKVVIDPVRTDTVSDLEAADPTTLHIRFRQGGDVMFNLAVSRVIFDNGWQDAEYLARAIDPESLEELLALVRQDRCLPEATAAAIALEGQDPAELAATIRQYAELIARPQDGRRPLVAFISSMGINQSTGSFGFSTNLNLLLLTGNVGRRGAGSLRIAGQSNATSELGLGFNSRRLLFNLRPDNPEHRAALSRVLDIPENNIPQSRGTGVSEMSDDDRLYCFLFVGTQMTRNMPRLGHWMRRLGRAFNVVIDCFLGDGVLEWADVILPAFTYTERTGVIQRGDRTLQLQQRPTEPPPQAWSDEQILARLALAIARRLRDPDTAALNDVDPDVVERTFGRYVDADGHVDSARVFDHVVDVSRQLDLYSRMEDVDGQPVSHALLRERAGEGVQWQGDGRYRQAREEGAVFPGLQRSQRRLAKLVRPPDAYIERLQAPLPRGTLNLLSGRGRPGRLGRVYRGRYNSGIKTLPLTGSAGEDYFVEVNPRDAEQRRLGEGSRVKMVSGHGAVVATVALNDRVPQGMAYIDFVPGEVNRLTDYVEADAFTQQSLIKRTPVHLNALAPLEATLWEAPDGAALTTAIHRLYERFRAAYPTDEGWLALQRREPDAVEWLHPRTLRDPLGSAERALVEAVGAFTAFVQKTVNDPVYRAAGVPVIRGLPPEVRERYLTVLLPLLRRLDYQSALHVLLADLVGGVRLVDDQGQETLVDLMSAHKSAVLEFKEEIVAIQLFIAVKRGIELLFGVDARVPRADLAFVSGVAIPCAGDVPAHFLGISPSELGAGGLVHSRAIGTSSLIIVDKRGRRAVRVDVHTGVLPKDRELTRLRGLVINRKRGATASDHRRFFDRLGELIVDYVRVGDGNFHLHGPVDMEWEEYRTKLGYSPAAHRDFREFLVSRAVSPALARALVGLGVLHEGPDAHTLQQLEDIAADRVSAPSAEAAAPLWGDRQAGSSLAERVDHVVRTVVGPVLQNDGGKLDILGVDEASGEISVRFVGSCANCPYSLLSMEQIVKPSLLAIQGVSRVVHRARMRKSELTEACARETA